MISTSFWAEVTIAGFFYFAAITFVFLRIADIKDLVFFSSIKEYLAFLSVGVVVLSYLFGIAAHRLVPIISAFTRISRNSNNDHTINLVHVFQYGSDRLHKELDFQFSLLTLFRSLSIAVPVFTCSFLVWLSDTIAYALTLPLLIFLLSLSMGLFIAYRDQRDKYISLQRAAFDEVLIIKNKNEKE